MKDTECVKFLQWALPRMGMRWAGFRKVRGQVCKRLTQRLKILGLTCVDDYRVHLLSHTDEWQVLDTFARITITRFYREKAVFQCLEREVLPALLHTVVDRGDTRLNVLSLGCASGEEPYSIAILWHFIFQKNHPDITLNIVATEADPGLIQRGRQACYPFSSVKNLPEAWRRVAFDKGNGFYCLKPVYRQGVHFCQQDIRRVLPEGRYDLILCRNLVFTYFDERLQCRTFQRITRLLNENGALVTGIHETLPAGQDQVTAWSDKLGIFRKSGTRRNS
jgi:chemotaxis protein methyltransferase CheR